MSQLRDEPRQGAGQARPKDAVDAVARATTSVRTEVLERNGIGNVRILSESKFLEILKSFLDRERGASREPSTPTATPTCDELERAQLEEAYEEKWAQLKARHEDSLKRIEGRMEKLSRVFQGLQGVLGRTEPEPGAMRAVEPVTEPSPKQNALLREMLLRGDAV